MMNPKTLAQSIASRTVASRTPIVAIALAILLGAVPASAGTKEQLIQLQTQVQALQDEMGQMRQSFDERMGVMRSLVEQTTDSINKMNASLEQLNQGMGKQSGDVAAKSDQVSAQVQALQDSVDELKGRLAKLSKQMDDMQAAQQNLQSAPAGATPGAPGAAAPTTPQADAAPPPDILYNNALRDYNAAKYDLAQQEFQQYLKVYPTTDLAGNAQFYLADIVYRNGDLKQAVIEYDKVLEQYPGGNKTAAAQLRKGLALIQLGDRVAGIKELRSLIARYPRTVEANTAREELRKIGAAASPSAASKPSAARRRR